jgi:hypothetical protein
MEARFKTTWQVVNSSIYYLRHRVPFKTTSMVANIRRDSADNLANFQTTWVVSGTDYRQ